MPNTFTTPTTRPSGRLRVSLDARYVREKPSGIGSYVQALINRLPYLAPNDQFLFWAHRLAMRPLSQAGNCVEVTVRPGPASPLPLLWPHRYAPFSDVDVFHSPHNLLPRGIPCASVVTIHDVMSIQRPDLHLRGFERFFKEGYYRQAVVRAIREATRIIAPTKATADQICSISPGASKRMTVTWEAVDPCFRPPSDVSEPRKSAAALTGASSPYFLVVGANAPTKRHSLALAAFAVGAPPSWRLVFLHRRGSRSQLARDARRLGVEDRVVWLDAKERDDVVVLMQGAEALVQPSVYEGFGLPVLEAMACGTAVLASDIPPFREITSGAAMLFPADDFDQFVAAVKELANNSVLRKDLGEAGLARSRDFSWDRCANETMATLREAAASHQGR